MPPKSTNTPSVEQPNMTDFVLSLRDQYGQGIPARGESRRLLYALLGELYAAIPKIEADHGKLQELRDLAGQDENVRSSKRFKPSDADSLDLLLVCVLSLKEETRATKSQWRSVILAASLEKVPATSVAFQEWLRGRGGIVEVIKGEVHVGAAEDGAIAGYENATPDADEAVAKLIAGKFGLKSWAGEIAQSPPTECLKLAIDRQTELYKGVGVLLYFAPEGGDPGEVRIVQKMGDPAVITRVAAEATPES